MDLIYLWPDYTCLLPLSAGVYLFQSWKLCSHGPDLPEDKTPLMYWCHPKPCMLQALDRCVLQNFSLTAAPGNITHIIDWENDLCWFWSSPGWMVDIKNSSFWTCDCRRVSWETWLEKTKQNKKKNTGDLLSTGGTHAEGVIRNITPELSYVHVLCPMSVISVASWRLTSPYTCSWTTMDSGSTSETHKSWVAVAKAPVLITRMPMEILQCPKYCLEYHSDPPGRASAWTRWPKSREIYLIQSSVLSIPVVEPKSFKP